MAEWLGTGDGNPIGGHQSALRQLECIVACTELHLSCEDEAHRYQIPSDQRVH